MNFKANDTLEEAKAGMYGKYLVDFYLTIDGLTNGSIISDGCYLAGNYGSFGWIVIPADGLELESGVCYPIVSAYDASLNYEDICKSVKDFTAAIYITDEILDANPNITVKLELKMTNPNDATDVIVIGDPAIFTFDDLKAGNPEEPAVDDLVFVQAPSLSFQDYIGMQVITKSNLLNSYDEIYVEATQITPDGTVVTRLEGVPYYGSYLLFDQQILSWSMTEQVTLKLCGVKNGKTYEGQSYTASVESLALNILNNHAADEDKAMCTVLVDMLNYGAVVQTAFNHNADNLPNANLGDYAAFGTVDVPATNLSNSISGAGTVTIAQQSLSMQSRVEIQLLFTDDISAYEVVATVGGEDAKVVVDADMFADRGWTLVKIFVASYNMRENHYITLYDADGNPVSQTYGLSVKDYAHALKGGIYNDVVVAMMKYGDSVKVIYDMQTK
jgi:hypothetical protein